MAKTSLTRFVDFVIKTGTPKLTVVRQCKNQPAYDPATDFYKILRDDLIDRHSNGGDIKKLSSIMASINDRSRASKYPALIKAYQKWFGRQTAPWFSPPHKTWHHGGLDVVVNPELGLTIKGVPHLIKLYFKDDQLSKSKVDTITHLMDIACGQFAPSGCVMSILDVQRSKLIIPTVPISGLTALLQGEAASWMTMWPLV